MTHLCNCSLCQCGNAGAEPGTARPNGKTCQRAADVTEPALGSHLITPRRGYTHHGIYAGGGMVLHYSGLSRSIRRGPVTQVPLVEFANGRGVQIECRDDRALDEQEIIRRARSRLGESRYSLLTNNCEHYSEWSRFGVSRSRQVDRWLSMPITVMRSVAAMARRTLWFSGSTGAMERATG